LYPGFFFECGSALRFLTGQPLYGGINITLRPVRGTIVAVGKQ
jgi:hypothetical protein